MPIGNDPPIAPGYGPMAAVAIIASDGPDEGGAGVLDMLLYPLTVLDMVLPLASISTPHPMRCVLFGLGACNTTACPTLAMNPYPEFTVNCPIPIPFASLIQFVDSHTSKSVIGVQKCPPTSDALLHVMPLWMWIPPVELGGSPLSEYEIVIELLLACPYM